ncbi:imidazoleglycerol-phosphate dehydratase HisB [Butyrivibrio sp. AE3009]|uniref:imidazoleglycerol-phosphate dehydratase HisB n=1 Tax=Butyrivibrio sp. AE3009 TaxID=1280666 RepID=UPI0003B4F0C5|nr:imidazoleglycerol-phosphate dehydratase HisB [Butyrivibrio sp. AE3009]
MDIRNASRIATVKRSTKETDIEITLNLDGSGQADIDTGIGFFDHMLDGFARHGLFDLTVKVKGDLRVDGHHTVEDTGIVLGKAIAEALGDKKGIKRYGSMILPMDETLVMSAVDLCGRPYFVMDADFAAPMVGEFDTQLVREFFYAVSYSAAMNLHLRVITGLNDHHKIEALFKAFSKALDEASSYDSRIKDVLSTKGAL